MHLFSYLLTFPRLKLPVMGVGLSPIEGIGSKSSIMQILPQKYLLQFSPWLCHLKRSLGSPPWQLPFPIIRLSGQGTLTSSLCQRDHSSENKEFAWKLVEIGATNEGDLALRWFGWLLSLLWLKLVVISSETMNRRTIFVWKRKWGERIWREMKQKHARISLKEHIWSMIKKMAIRLIPCSIPFCTATRIRWPSREHKGRRS